MSAPAERPIPTLREHAERERVTGLRHELVDGVLFAMTAGTPAHSRVKTNLVGMLYRALGEGPGQVFDGDLRLRVGDDVLYPDASVHCGEFVVHADDPTAATAPVLVAEVLSPSTEAWDRGGKFARYRAIPSVRHVLLIDPDRRTVEHDYRDEARWILVPLAEAEALTLPLAGRDIELPLSELFRNLPTATAQGR